MTRESHDYASGPWSVSHMTMGGGGGGDGRLSG